MPQITQLDNDPTPNNNDLLVTVDMAAGTTKNISREQFLTGAPLPADTVDSQAIADGSVTTGKINNSAVTAGKTAFGGNYSTSEINTGFKWIDGKDIYKKTVALGMLPNNVTKNVPHNVSGIALIIECTGWAANDTPTFVPLPYATAGTGAIQLWSDHTNIRLSTATDRTEYNGYVTILYTKS